LLRFRHQFVPALHKRYGDTFTVRTVPGGMPMVLVSRPEHTREIFAGDPEIFHAGKGNAILGPVMGEHSLLLLDSAEHRRMRALLMPAFTGGALQGYAALVRRLADDEVRRWPPGVPFRSLDRMRALTLEVILRVVFGVSDEGRLQRLRPLVRRTVDVSPAVLLGWGYPLLRRFPPWTLAAENQRALDAVLYAEIAERRAVSGLGERTDVLSRLLCAGAEGEGGQTKESCQNQSCLSDGEVRDQLVTLLLAGHETTATALSWCLYELGRNPAQQARAEEAAVGGDDTYLEATVKEAMRLHPVIPMVLRELSAPATVAGYRLPAGTTVGPSILIAHSRSESHPEPELFRPERFLGGDIAPNTWIPFGGGVRRCIGAAFSLMEGVEVLRTVLLRYAVAVPPGRRDAPKVRNITSVPRHGGRIVVRPKQAASSLA
jgi:cytochrome P450 family 135